jgi:hypothetical protein
LEVKAAASVRGEERAPSAPGEVRFDPGRAERKCLFLVAFGPKYPKLINITYLIK